MPTTGGVVAKTIATITGTALRPGVSANKRWYKPEHVVEAVRKAQERLKAGEKPMVMLTFHGADDNSQLIAASLTGASLNEQGEMDFAAGIVDTPAGWDIARLADTSDGKPAHLKNVSIRGYWTGTVRKVKGPDGQMVETADGVVLDGVDFTRSPGVSGAEIKTFAWTGRPGYESQTTERVAITESVQEASVTFTEETEPEVTSRPTAVAEGLADLLPVPHILNDGTCLTCEASPPLSQRGSGTSGAGRVWADPGYQKDKKQRYDLTSKQNAKSAWAYINQPDNAKPYTAAQLKRIKSKIKAALSKFGVQVAAESADWADGWTYDAPVQVGESLAEHYGDPSCRGSWSVNASNGPVNINLSSYSMAPEDLDVILRAAADAACKALAALDPDMDGDVDVPGVGDNSDPDGDAGEESAPDEGEQETESQAAAPAAETEREDPAMGETTNPAESAAPAIDPKALAEAVAGILGARDEAKAAAKAEKRARKAAESATAAQAVATATESAAATGTATETEDARKARLQKMVDEQFAAKAAQEGLTVVKTDEQLVAEMIEERMVPLRQARAEGGGVQRKGIAQLEALADAPGITKKLSEASNEELAAMAGAAFGPHGSNR
jgi:hypothetical protein